LGEEFDYPVWSMDSRYVYFSLFRYPIEPRNGFYRYSLDRWKRERVLTMPDFILTGNWGNWTGLAPDGSPLLLRWEGSSDIYALDLDLQ
jgi:hypothetical protein